MQHFQSESDLEIARQLQEKFDKEAAEIQALDDDVIDVTDPIETVEIEDVPQDDDCVIVESSYDLADEVFVTGASSINFVIEELGIKYNPATSFDWKRHEMKLNINAIFKRLNKLYFNEPQCFANIELGWTTDLEDKPARLRLLSDKTQISLNHNLKLVPRIDFITHLVRIMLILYIREKYGLANNIPAFKRNFVKALERMNSVWLTNIQENSLVKFNHEIDKRSWYRCTGMCQDHSPFYGIFRSHSEPGGQCSWWLPHRTNCSATLFRLYEVTKFVGDSPSPEDRFFVTNVKHRSVKVDLKKANKNLLKPTEVIDLDAVNFLAPPEHPHYIDIIDIQRIKNQLYDRRVTDPVDRLGFKPADEFIKMFNQSLGVDYNGYLIPCPFCQEKLNRRLFAEHFDGCMGFSKKVEYKPVSHKWEEWPNAKRVKY